MPATLRSSDTEGGAAVNVVTVTFLVIGGLGVLVLAVSLFVGDVLHLGHPDLDGPFSVPAVAGFIGAFGFAGAIAAALTGSGGFAWLAGVVVGGLAAVPTAFAAMRLGRLAARIRTDDTPTRSD